MREQFGLQPYSQACGTQAGWHSHDDPNTVCRDLYNTRPPTSTIRWQQPQRAMRITHHQGPPPIQRASRQAPATTQGSVPRRHWLAGKHPLFYIGGCLCLLLIGSSLLNAATSWVNVQEDQLHYGYPRTYQTDADVGHGGVSHFTVENEQGHIYAYELPNNDASKSAIIVGPVLSGPGADLAPAIIEFADINHDGRPDAIIDVDHARYIYLNGADGKFHAQQTGG